jgi:hypothetical protein
LPTYYVESNGYAYSLEGLDKALVTLRIEKIQGEKPLFIQEEKQEKQPNATTTTTRMTSRSKQTK